MAGESITLKIACDASPLKAYLAALGEYGYPVNAIYESVNFNLVRIEQRLEGDVLKLVAYPSDDLMRNAVMHADV